MNAVMSPSRLDLDVKTEDILLGIVHEVVD